MGEFFDEGVSRRAPWPDRPQAARLLDAVMDSARGFDAVVVGEYERAFHGQQLEQLTPTLVRHGVQLWLPETYGQGYTNHCPAAVGAQRDSDARASLTTSSTIAGSASHLIGGEVRLVGP
ncbi:hypothetical protein AB0C42_15600 [Micromonospora taraxaci]|uniref:hypothetical protein n=1 Tax=Micromonospora taraxaci TaxID=1316803 RepID=UPI0033FBFC9A